MDEHKLAIVAMMCDGMGCVARYEELHWPEGPISNVEQALSVSDVLATLYRVLLGTNLVATIGITWYG